MQEKAGIDAIVPCGTTGESATLTHKEHLKVIGIVREEAKRAKVIAGAGSNATHEAIHLTRGRQGHGRRRRTAHLSLLQQAQPEGHHSVTMRP